MKIIDFNCYGESLDSTPDFFSLKRAYEENLLIDELNMSEENSKFEVLKITETLNVDMIKETLNKEEYDKKNQPN